MLTTVLISNLKPEIIVILNFVYEVKQIKKMYTNKIFIKNFILQSKNPKGFFIFISDKRLLLNSYEYVL